MEVVIRFLVGGCVVAVFAVAGAVVASTVSMLAWFAVYFGSWLLFLC
jgi:hypothetical protein